MEEEEHSNSLRTSDNTYIGWLAGTLCAVVGLIGVYGLGRSHGYDLRDHSANIQINNLKKNYETDKSMYEAENDRLRGMISDHTAFEVRVRDMMIEYQERIINSQHDQNQRLLHMLGDD